MDLPEARERFTQLAERLPGLRAVSAATGEGVRELMVAAWQTIQATPVPEIAVPEPPRTVLTPKEPFEIHVEDGVYVVSGERIERLAAMTDFESDEALGRFERILAKMGVDRRLRELGAGDGDTVRIAGNEFTYS
jgi:GTP-binding protein